MSRFNMADSRHTDTRTSFSACSSCCAKNTAMSSVSDLVCNAGAIISASAFFLVIGIIGYGIICRISIIIIISIIISIIKMLPKSKPNLYANR